MKWSVNTVLQLLAPSLSVNLYFILANILIWNDKQWKEFEKFSAVFLSLPSTSPSSTFSLHPLFPNVLSSQLHFPINYLAADFRPQLLTISVTPKKSTHFVNHIISRGLVNKKCTGKQCKALFFPSNSHALPTSSSGSRWPSTVCFPFSPLWNVNRATDWPPCRRWGFMDNCGYRLEHVWVCISRWEFLVCYRIQMFPQKNQKKLQSCVFEDLNRPRLSVGGCMCMWHKKTRWAVVHN